MSLVEIKGFNALIEKKIHFLISQLKTKKKRRKSLFKCQKVMAIQQEVS